jgi:FHA domain/TIR domain
MNLGVDSSNAYMVAPLPAPVVEAPGARGKSKAIDPSVRVPIKRALLGGFVRFTDFDDVRPMQRRPTRVFLLHAPGDATRAGELDEHLRASQQAGLVITWHGQKVSPGADAALESARELEAADVVVLLVTVTFLNSDDCSEGTRRALARRETGACEVVPLLVRPVDWALAPFAHLDPLPRNGRAIELWPSPEEAWAQVALELRALAQRVQKTAAASPPAPTSLILRSVGEPAEYHFVFGPAALLGRSTACDFAFPLAPSAMSKRHARLVSPEAAEPFVLEDLGSRHGTLRNSRPIAGRSPLTDGDEITLGGFSLHFRRRPGRAGQLAYRAPEARGMYVLSADDEVEVAAERGRDGEGFRVRRARGGFSVAPDLPSPAAWAELSHGARTRLGWLWVDVEVRR